METKKNKKQKITRKKFLQLCGSLLAGGSIVGLSGFLFHRRFSKQGITLGSNATGLGKENFISPYKPVASFKVPGTVDAFEMVEEMFIVASSNNLYLFDTKGKIQHKFSIPPELRDIVAGNSRIYLLFPTRIGVYSREGEWICDWEACSGESDYCSMALSPEALFVTDAANKNICQYTLEGNFVRFIQSPDNFIIPSYSFGITYIDGVIYCSNSGRHRIEKYSSDGKYLGSFGKPGGAPGMFCGCCNPVHLTPTSTGEIITSEKGDPRICCYGTDGQFRALLLDSKSLGGGNNAYEVKVLRDKIFVASKNKITTFQYNPQTAATTACGDCKASCPLRM